MSNLLLKKFRIVTISLLSLVFACLIVVACSCSKNVKEPQHFAFDSWDTLASVSEKGLDKLKEVYKPIGGTFIIQDLNDDNEVFAKTRQIDIEGIGSFTCRVIGENHDVYDNGKTAPLTFEFTSLINYIPYNDTDHYNNHWENSNLRNYLNKKLYDMFPSNVKSVIKPVKKETCTGGCDEVKEYSEKLFILSASEINVAQKWSLVEGKPYEFYEKYKYNPGSEDDPRYKDEKMAYWLRSPLKENAENCSMIRRDENEDLDTELAYEDVMSRLSVSPCFCI